MKIDRPKRKNIPVAVKRRVVERQGGRCACGCGEVVSARTKSGTHFDHMPALRLRDVNPARTDYSPPQHHPDYLDALTRQCHDRKTRGAGTSRKRSMAGTDVGRITKERKREREARGVKPKHRWGKQKMQSVKRPWPKRKIRR